MNILILTSSHDQLGDTGEPTGVWLEELAAPHYVFADAGGTVEIASVAGGDIPLDPKSRSDEFMTDAAARFLDDDDAMKAIKTTRALPGFVADVAETVERFDGLFLPGGHGPMWDFAENTQLGTLVSAFYLADKPIGSACHGVAGLLPALVRGKPLVDGQRVTAFTNSEESAMDLAGVVPFLLETRLRELGGTFEKGPDFEARVVGDGLLVTGQNPSSSAPAAERLMGLI